MNEIETFFESSFIGRYENGHTFSSEEWVCDLVNGLFVFDSNLHCINAKFRDIDDKYHMEAQLVLLPQRQIKRYYVDFILVGLFGNYGPVEGIGIEIDGHEWHEKTKEQAARDKKRDREILLNNVPIMRFTGSEIHRDVKACIDECLMCYINLSYIDFWNRELRNEGHN